jgi:DNA-binding SARP family transcriptional activator/Tfp pilus assembly protein PilF
MEFCLLGPLVVRSGGAVVPLRRGKQRAVLAALLLEANQVVPVDTLAETLWGSIPPLSARVTVQNYVKRLRQALGDDRCAVIRTAPRGYLISLDDSELDLNRFRAQVAAAAAAARDGAWQEAADRAGAALSLWRGEPLDDADSPVLAAREAPRLREMRLQAQETRAEAELHLGRHAGALPELRRLAGAHPLREKVHALLLLALYRDGRQREALAAYENARQILISEIGCEPGAALQKLHRQILAADPALAAPRAAPAAVARRPPPVPCELPADVPHFTGRAGELAALTSMLDERRDRTPGHGPIAVISGTAGVGKTALAVHWAHRIAGRFPDGQLYVNLRGFDPDQPLPASDALAGFLRALGVPGQDIPAGEDERAARYRSLLAGRRALVLLDNAGSAEQVRPLLPGVPGCAVVVTSRDSLTGLVTGDGAVRRELRTLPLEEAVDLLRALIGGKVDADPAAASALTTQCAGLPLALRVAAELAAARPGATLSTLVHELADQERRLDLLDAGGDRRAAVRAVLSWSYRHLDARDARMFRLIGLHPGPDLDRYAAAALAGGPVAEAGQALDRLARAHLIQPVRPGRYGPHDLLRAYGRELAAGMTAGERRQALTGLYDYYLRASGAAMDAVFPAWRGQQPTAQGPDGPIPPVGEPAAARAWLDAERPSLVAAAAHMARDAWPGHITRLATTIFRYLNTAGYFADAVTISRHARDAARQRGDRAAETAALTDLGVVDWWQGRLPEASDQLQQALALSRETGDRFAVGRVLANLGLVYDQQGRYPEALAHFQEALAIFQAIGERTAEAYTFGNLGAVYRQQGRYDEAFGCYRQALALCRETGDLDGQGQTLARMGFAATRQDRAGDATGYLTQALDLFGQTGNRAGQAQALTGLGAAERQQGHYQEAIGFYLRALELCREIGDQGSQSRVLNGLGDVLLSAGQVAEALARHTAALSLATQIGHKIQEAHAHDGLAAGHHEAGDVRAARHHWEQALTLYTELAMPEAGQVRARLDGLLVS